MIKVVALVVFFTDGYLGGHTTAAYFYTKERCQELGQKLAIQYTGYGHPSTFACLSTTLPKQYEKHVHK